MPEIQKALKVVTPPKPGDYLQKAIRGKIIDKTIKHPLSVYPIAAGASCGFVGWLFNMPVLYMAAFACVLAGVLFSVSRIFIFREKMEKEYINKMNIKQKQYEEYLKILLRKELKECCAIEGLEKYAAQGRTQFEQIQEKYTNIQELLKLKISSTELTFARFIGAAEQVNLSVFDNLKSIVAYLKSTGSIHADLIETRLDGKNSNDNLSDDEIKQNNALKKRLQLREEQLNKVKILLAKNESAMTEMEIISAAIAQWQQSGGFAGTDFESAITRLQELAETAHVYDNV